MGKCAINNMNNDPNMYFRTGVMHGPEDMNVFMPNMQANRAQVPSYPTSLHSVIPQQPPPHMNPSGYLTNRFHGLTISNRPQIMPPVRVVHHTMPQASCPIMPFMCYSPYPQRFPTGPPQNQPVCMPGPPPTSVFPQLPQPPPQPHSSDMMLPLPPQQQSLPPCNTVPTNVVRQMSLPPLPAQQLVVDPGGGGSNSIAGDSRNHTPANLSPSLPSRLPLNTVTIVQDGDGIGYSHHQHSRTAKSKDNFFYSSNNLENTKKLQESNSLQPPSWYLYPPVPESASYLRTGRQHITVKKEKPSFFIDPELRHMFLNRIRACLLSPDSSLPSKVPKTLSIYEDLTLLESPIQVRISASIDLPCICLKGFSRLENKVVLLRRVLGAPTFTHDPSVLLARFKEIQHPNLIPIRDIFTTGAFGDSSLIFVMDYLPCSVSLLQAHMSDPMKLNGFASPFNVDKVARPHSSSKNAADLNMLPEPTAWNYLIQLIHMMRYVHRTLGLSCRTIDPSKILVQDGQRVRLNCFGMLDLLQFDPRKSSQEIDSEIAVFQSQDLVNLGKLMVSMTCGTAVAVQDSQLTTALELVVKCYKEDLSGIIQRLVLGQTASIDDVVSCTAAQCYDHLTLSYSHNDFLERQLMREMESGRLFRLVCKLMTICERTDLENEQEWAETEDRYMLKLFRDFVFHQTDQNSGPWIDLAHIVACLNKVDAGSIETLALASRDSQNLVIVTYADVKRWLDDSFDFLVERQHQSMRQNIPPIYYSTDFLGIG